MLRACSLTLVGLLAFSVACSGDGAGSNATSTSGAGGSGSGGDDGGAGGDDAGSGPVTTAAQGTTATSAAGGAGGEGGASSSSSGDPEADGDGDGFTENEGDCNDLDADVSPDGVETCNLVDDDCDGERDEDFDADGDGFSACGLDCDDAVATTHPGGDELAQGQNGVDDDCNGVVDEPWTDQDADGFSEATGDCDDLQPEINPNALEFPGNSADDDCDGQVDEALVPCDGGALDANNPLDYARAMGLCNGEVLSAQFVSGTAASRGILTAYGTHVDQLNRPAEGARMVHLSSGTVDSTTKNSGTEFDGGNFGCTSSPHPAPTGDPGACGAADPASVCDKTEISLQIRVPSNANSFTYQFQFFSAEYMTWRCSAYDDTFLALLSSQAFNGNISFDQNGNVMSVNTGFFDVCYDDLSPSPPNLCTENPDATLAATGYASASAGATNPLTTTSPVVPGEVITLRFVIFDEGDDILDSSVMIDNFRWSLDAADGPSTEE